MEEEVSANYYIFSKLNLQILKKCMKYAITILCSISLILKL